MDARWIVRSVNFIPAFLSITSEYFYHMIFVPSEFLIRLKSTLSPPTGTKPDSSHKLWMTTWPAWTGGQGIANFSSLSRKKTTKKKHQKIWFNVNTCTTWFTYNFLFFIRFFFIIIMGAILRKKNCLLPSTRRCRQT